MSKLQNLIARCPYCNSIWVCWNWCYSDLDELVKLNPTYTREEVAQTLWVHECWDCGDVYGGACHETPNKVTNGMPHWFLERFHEIHVWWRYGIGYYGMITNDRRYLGITDETVEDR